MSLAELPLWGQSPWLAWTEISGDVGIGGEEVGDYGPLWVDLNGDSCLDLVFLNHGAMPAIYLNRDGGSFENSLSRSGIRTSNWQYNEQSDRHGGSCADFDNDGDMDLLITHGARRGETLGDKYDELLENLGDGRFVERLGDASPQNQQGRARMASWVDYNDDGLLDLYLGNLDSPNVLYRNEGDGVFSDQTEPMGLGLASAPRVAWFDVDLDGDSDLISLWPLSLHRNDGIGGFVDITESLGLKQETFRSPKVIGHGDFNNDGRTDLVIGSRHHSTALMLREDSGFREVQGVFSPVEEEVGSGLAVGDLDLDGDLDLILGSSRRLRFFDNRQGELVEQKEMQIDSSFGEMGDVALGDFDADGDLDLAVSGAEQHFLFRNEASSGSWLQIVFHGGQSNRMGLGAKVWVSRTVGEKEELLVYRDYQGDSSVFSSMGCGPLHLGLGEGVREVNLEIRWPSGVESEMKGVKVNQFLGLKEPAVVVQAEGAP